MNSLSWAEVAGGAFLATGILATGFVMIYVAVYAGFGRRFGLQLDAISKKVEGIVESQRLSVLLEVQPKVFDVGPIDFEPDRAILKARVMDVLEEQDKSRDRDFRSRANTILYSSGLEAFLSFETEQKVKTAIIRLLANRKKAELQRFLEGVVSKL